MTDQRDTDGETATVLIVEDDTGVADVFRLWLEPEYDVQVAPTGEDALEVLETEDVDVVLLDRVMPGLSGDEVLEVIEAREYDIQVAIVSAVEPDFDVLSMGFDDYVTKPSSRAELRDTVETLLRRRRQSTRRKEYHALLSKRAAIEAQKESAELEENEEYTELLERIETLSAELEAADPDLLDDTEFVSRIRRIHTDGDPKRPGGEDNS